MVPRASGAIEDDFIISLIWMFLAMWKTRVSYAGAVNPGLDEAMLKRGRNATFFFGQVKTSQSPLSAVTRHVCRPPRAPILGRRPADMSSTAGYTTLSIFLNRLHEEKST